MADQPNLTIPIGNQGLAVFGRPQLENWLASWPNLFSALRLGAAEAPTGKKVGTSMGNEKATRWPGFEHRDAARNKRKSLYRVSAICIAGWRAGVRVASVCRFRGSCLLTVS
jgi:hypothetical protein